MVVILTGMGNMDRVGSRRVWIGNAPVSFGVFEMTPDDAVLPDPEDLLLAISASGYEGVDLGPVGYLGGVGQIGERLISQGLSLTGGWLQFDFLHEEHFAQQLSALPATLDIFCAASAAADRAGNGRPAPHPTLAEGGGRTGGSDRLGASQWSLVAKGVSEVAQRCRERGLEPTFHHHMGTCIETPNEIDELLERTDVGLCLDTGHLLLGGGDPVEGLRRWSRRVNHVHIKDASLAVVEQVRREQLPMIELWRRHGFVPLGAGNMDVDGFLSELRSSDYRGWMVVEEDHLPPLHVIWETAGQARNRLFLEQRGF